MATLARGNPARWWTSRSCGAPSRAPAALLVSPIRRRLGLITFIFLVLLLGGFWYATNPARIKSLSQALLSRVLGGRVTVQDARLSFSGTLILTGIEVSPSDAEADASLAARQPIFTAQQIEARFDWLSLLTGQLSATQLVAITPVFHPIEEIDAGHWNYERLHPGLGGGSPNDSSARGLTLPVVILRDAHVKWSEERDGHIEQTAETIIDGEMTPDPVFFSTYHFQFAQIAPGEPGAAAQDVNAILRGTWDSANNTFTASTENIIMSEALRRGLPRVARLWCQEHQLSGRVPQMLLNFTPKEGLSVTVTFDDVSMMWMVQPEPGIAIADDAAAYPLDITKVRGKVIFTANPAAMHIVDLSGDVMGYHFVADCDVQGNSFDAPFNVKLRFPNAKVEDHYPPLFMAFTSSQDLLQRIGPHGNMDIGVEIHRKTLGADVTYEGAVDMHNATMRFAHFPFPIDHVNGRLSFDEKTVAFNNVTGKGDVNDVLITGSAGTSRFDRYIDITITSSNVFIDDRVAACLAQNYQDIWDMFAIRAHGSFVCKVTRPHTAHEADGTDDDMPNIVVDLLVDEGHGYIKNVPYNFTNAKGKLHFEPELTRIDSFSADTGLDGTGRITLSGVVHHEGGALARLLPELTLTADVPLDTDLLHALPEEYTQHLRNVDLGGHINFQGTVLRTIDANMEPKVQVAGLLNWSGGTLNTTLSNQPIALSAISAQATLSPDAVDLKELRGIINLGTGAGGQPQSITASLSGKLLTDTLSGQVQVSMIGSSITLPSSTPSLFPKNFADIWHDYSPSGSIDLNAQATVRVNLPDAPSLPQNQAPIRVSDSLVISSYNAAVGLHDASVKYTTWSDPLKNLQGTIDLAPGKVTMTNMKASLANISLAWSGGLQTDTGSVNLSGTAVAQGWPTQYLSYLPESVSSKLDLKREGVSLSLKLDSLTRDASDKPWALAGTLQTANAALAGPLPISSDSAEITGKGLFSSAISKDASPAFEFTGTLAARNLSFNNRIIDPLTADITASSSTHLVSISNVAGSVAGGNLQGMVEIYTAGAPETPATQVADASQPATVPMTMPEARKDGGYRAELVLNDADLSKLLAAQPSADDTTKLGTGHVTASLSLQETFGDHADRTGRGELVVRDGDIYNVPLSMGLMQVATLRLPVAKSFQQASMSYYLRNSDITFERILLESQGINLAGVGTISMADHTLDMSFVTETPREAFIPIITPIVGGLQKNLLQLSVTGTLDNPKVTAVPLSPISNVLRAILSKPRADARH